MNDLKKRKRCSQCRSKLDHESEETRYTPIYVYCCCDCQNKHAISMRDKMAAKRKEREAQGLPPKKIGVKVKLEDRSLAHHRALTKAVMQKYARLRDAYYNYPCISCDKHHKSYDGGHYKAADSHYALTFDLRNINRECKNCNWYNKDHLDGMRVNIAKRYGQERLDFLNSVKNEDMNPSWSDKAYLARMRKIFNKRMKRYE